MARSIKRARSFLLLAGSLGVVLAGLALAMATRRYTERHADYVAIMKTLGASAALIRALYAGNLLLLALAGILLGWALGWLVQVLAFMAVREILAIDLPGAGSLKSLWLGAGTGALCLLGLAVPPLLRMAGLPRRCGFCGAMCPLRVPATVSMRAACWRSRCCSTGTAATCN